MRYRKTHAVAGGIGPSATETLVYRDQGFGGTVSVSDGSGLGRASGGVFGLKDAVVKEKTFGHEGRDDRGKEGPVSEETYTKVDHAGSFDAKDVSFLENTASGLPENWLLEIDSPQGLSSNEMTCGTEFSSWVPRDDKGTDVRPASGVDNVIETVERRAGKGKRPVPVLSVSDLVWGKVRSHPWWPGQIFDPSAASEKAKKHIKKNRLLIAYFGDQTFAWNDAASIKPFKECFPRMVKQSNTDNFCNAVDCALDELSRRVEYGLACRCLPEEVYGSISAQRIINAGINEDLLNTDVRDKCCVAASFEPVRLIQYVRGLAKSPLGEGDRLELVVKQARLLAFSRWRGYRELPNLEMVVGLSDNDGDNIIPSRDENPRVGRGRDGDSGKFKPVVLDTLHSGKKERNLSDLKASKRSSYVKKRKAQSSASDEALRVKRSESSGDDSKSIQAKQNFKVGDKIRKIANEINGFCGSSCISREGIQLRLIKPTVEQNSSDKMMALLHSIARDATDKYSAFTPIKSFFTEFRDFSVSVQDLEVETIRSSTIGLTAENLDGHGNDRVIQREDQTADEEGIAAENLGSNDARDTESKEDNNLTALILYFDSSDSIPSEANLNSIFNRFGPLMESETEVFKKTKRAKVVFKRRTDAETAFSSSGKYNTFGPSLLSYRLKYGLPIPACDTARTQKRARLADAINH